MSYTLLTATRGEANGARLRSSNPPEPREDGPLVAAGDSGARVSAMSAFL